MKLVWLSRAIANRDALIDHIAQENLKAAIEQDNRIDMHTDQLVSNPELGRTGRKHGTRELVISRTHFIAVYRIKAKRIEVLRILHTSQAWPAQES